jgi:hypothetical protein
MGSKWEMAVTPGKWREIRNPGLGRELGCLYEIRESEDRMFKEKMLVDQAYEKARDRYLSTPSGI